MSNRFAFICSSVVLVLLGIVDTPSRLLADEAEDAPSDSSSGLSVRVKGYIDREGKLPGIMAFSELVVGTQVDYLEFGEVLSDLDSRSHSEEQMRDIRAVRDDVRLSLEPLLYTAEVDLTDRVAGTRSKTVDTVAVDGYRLKYLRDGLGESSNTEKGLRGYGFDGEYFFRYQATRSKASGYVGLPPSSRKQFFPRSHLLQKLLLMRRDEDLLGRDAEIAMSIDSFTSNVWQYDGPEFTELGDLVAIGDPLSYVILNPARSFMVVGGTSGRVAVDNSNGNATYVWSDSYSENKAFGAIPINDSLSIPKTYSLSVYRHDKEVLSEVVKLITVRCGEELTASVFDVIPDGVSVMNEVSNLGYVKGGDKRVPLVVESSLRAANFGDGGSRSSFRMIMILVNVVAAAIVAVWFFLTRRPRV